MNTEDRQQMLQEADDLDELFRLMKRFSFDGNLDWTDLPTFGGPDIQDTNCIWSWDPTRRIVGECSENLVLCDREDVAAPPAAREG